MMVLLQYLSNFWRTLEIPLTNCEISHQLDRSTNCFLVDGAAAGQEPRFKITDTKLCDPVVPLSTQDNVKLLEQVKSGFKKTIDPSFQGVNKLFVSSFEDINVRESYKRYFLPTIEIKDYNVMIDGRNFLVNQ